MGMRAHNRAYHEHRHRFGEPWSESAGIDRRDRQRGGGGIVTKTMHATAGRQTAGRQIRNEKRKLERNSH